MWNQLNLQYVEENFWTLWCSNCEDICCEAGDSSFENLKYWCSRYSIKILIQYFYLSLNYCPHKFNARLNDETLTLKLSITTQNKMFQMGSLLSEDRIFCRGGRWNWAQPGTVTLGLNISMSRRIAAIGFSWTWIFVCGHPSWKNPGSMTDFSRQSVWCSG